MSMTSRMASSALAAAFLLPACGGPTVVEEEPTEERAARIDRTYTRDGLLMERFDINHDTIGDAFHYHYVLDEDGNIIDRPSIDPKDADSLQLVRKEQDMNFDGNIDVVRHYDEFGRLRNEQMDINFDGVLDYELHYERGTLARKDIDYDGDGIFDEFRHYRTRVLHRIELDEDADGQIDTWKFYVGGALTRVGRDRDRDGIVDNWQFARTDDGRPDIMQTALSRENDAEQDEDVCPELPPDDPRAYDPGWCVDEDPDDENDSDDGAGDDSDSFDDEDAESGSDDSEFGDMVDEVTDTVEDLEDDWTE